MPSKRVAVTGGAGFIGSHIVEASLLQGYDVIVIDDLSTGSPRNLKPFKNDIVFVRGSIMDQEVLKRAFLNVDYVIHQAAIVSVPESIRDPIQTHQINVVGTLNVFLAARACGAKRVVYASSSAVYGDVAVSPIREDALLSPITPYAVQKVETEMYAKVFGGLYNLETVGFRYFNVFGPRQNIASPYAAVIPLFVQAIKNGVAPTIYGDGSQTRDFVYVKDVAKANLLACTVDSISDGIFNVGSGRTISINDLFQKVLQALGKQQAPHYAPQRPGDIMHSGADVAKIKELLGFVNSTDFDIALRETVQSY
jgi:nucleoside-diphosphate-sugar epimerase